MIFQKLAYRIVISIRGAGALKSCQKHSVNTSATGFFSIKPSSKDTVVGSGIVDKHYDSTTPYLQMSNQVVERCAKLTWSSDNSKTKTVSSKLYCKFVNFQLIKMLTEYSK